MEQLSGVISLRLKPMIQSVGEADFSKRWDFTIVVKAVAVVKPVAEWFSVD